jgi:hypothetical protein
MYAYLFGEMARMGIDVAGESQLVGYPTQFPSVSMVDWNTGKPNARFWVLKLLHANFGPGDKLADLRDSPSSRNPYVYALPVITENGKKRILLVNKSERSQEVQLVGAGGGQMEYVDETTGMDPPKTVHLRSDQMSLNEFSVAAVTFPQDGAGTKR